VRQTVEGVVHAGIGGLPRIDTPVGGRQIVVLEIPLERFCRNVLFGLGNAPQIVFELWQEVRGVIASERLLLLGKWVKWRTTIKCFSKECAGIKT
jgi:hypothetical protein